MLEKIKSVNRNMLIWAREQSLGNFDGIAEEFVEKILKWEKGDESPN